MNISMEYYKIFYYVAKYKSIRKGCIPDQRGNHALFLCEKRI